LFSNYLGDRVWIANSHGFHPDLSIRRFVHPLYEDALLRPPNSRRRASTAYSANGHGARASDAAAYTDVLNARSTHSSALYEHYYTHYIFESYNNVALNI